MAGIDDRQSSRETVSWRSKIRRYTRANVLSLILIVIGLSLLAYVGGQYWLMAHTQKLLEIEWEHEKAPAGPMSPAAPPLMRIRIAKINLDAIVVDGASRKQLAIGPGHILQTALPGETGNAVITGHRDTFFRHIFELEKGDEITIARNGETFHYEVTGKKVVSPEDVSVLNPTNDAQLTLITCYPIYYIGPAPKRLVVFSKLAPRSGTIVSK